MLIILINTVIPFLFIYGKLKANEIIKKNAIILLEELPAEKNVIIKKWENIGITARNAFYSQALLQLKNEYCKVRKCLQCGIGNKIINT